MFWNLFLTTLAIARGQFNPNYVPGRTVMVFLMDWKYQDVALECERFLGPKGFGGVQVSSPAENDIVTDPLRPWWERYQIISYIIGSRSGNEDDFADMCYRCNKVGVLGTAGSTADGPTKSYPAVPYDASNFHPSCPLTTFQVTFIVRNCELFGAPDLDQAQPYVREKIKGYLDHLITLGIAGFRVDSAKHMWPKDLKAIYSSLRDLNTDFGFPPKSRPFVFQEVIDAGGGSEPINKYEYSPIGVVTEFLYSYILTDFFRGNRNLSDLATWGQSEWKFLPSKAALVFVENHDNERATPPVLNYKDGKPYWMAVAFELAHPYGYPYLMSDFNWTTYDQGPPMDEDQNIISPTINKDGSCGSGWVCQHRWRQIYSMVGFRNQVGYARFTNFWSNGKNQIAFARQGCGFVAFNNDDVDLNEVLQTTLPAGTYCDVSTGYAKAGECTGRTVVVGDDGTATIEISSSDDIGFIAIHIGQML
uniref:alpha-amylase n=1 Tax=Lutzomyia longipalpis TaxID=7200 RepID=A0A1B0EV09_LUTLO